jgi:formylglycine-generating enzyme required for sulfatase activity
MRKNYMTYLAALLLVGAVGIMTAGAQSSGKPTLAVFVVGMASNTDGDNLATQIAAELNRNSRYDVLPSTNNAVLNKLTELRKQNASSIDRSALAAWGRANGISAICLVTDAIKGNDHMFYALLIDAKDSKVSGRGSYIRTNVTANDLPRVSLSLSRQLDAPAYRRSAPIPVRSYPAELDIEMVRVEGGKFTMGCTPEQDRCDSDERPAHTMTVSSFSIGKYLITRAQWLAVMQGHPTLADPGNWRSDDQLPIESVSWLDIDTAFLPRLNALTGRTTKETQYRLPTEAEWEYAARGCKAGVCDSYKYSGSDNVDEVGWYIYNSGRVTHPVGQRKPNGLGIYDMSGNVWEWCYDWYAVYSDPNYLGANATDYTGPTTGANRAQRGGRVANYDTSLRTPSRSSDPPDLRSIAVGFRVVLP